MNTITMLHRLVEPDGGFTLDLLHNREPSEGFAVSIYPEHAAIFTRQQFNYVSLMQYITLHQDTLILTGRHLGAWHNPENHQIYLDISVVVASREEAVDLCISHDQIAYYDIAAKQSVTVEGSELDAILRAFA